VIPEKSSAIEKHNERDRIETKDSNINKADRYRAARIGPVAGSSPAGRGF
jgi:hypothetical protein